MIRPKAWEGVSQASHAWVFLKRYEQWEKAVMTIEKQIERYELYSWLVQELREGLEFVDAETGCLRSVEEMEAIVGVVALLMREIPPQGQVAHLKVQAIAERLERQKGELVKYIAPLQEKLAELEAEIGDGELVRLCLSVRCVTRRLPKEWRLEKKTAQRRKQESLETCRKRLLKWKEEVVKHVRKTVRWLLGQVVRASSLVETINSWLRPFPLNKGG